MSPIPSSIRVYPSGEVLDLLNPNPAQIDIMDIAWAGAHICRWGGHINRHWPYTINQHAIGVAHEVRFLGAKLPALLHDATEVYLGDVISPLKRTFEMAQYRQIEDQWMRVIMRRFGALKAWDFYEAEIHRADKALLERERAALKGNPDDYTGPVIPKLTHEQVVHDFLCHFRAYSNQDLFPFEQNEHASGPSDAGHEWSRAA